MQTEQSGDTNSKAAVVQQLQANKKKSVQKPKSTSTSSNIRNVAAVNEETTVNAAQIANSTIKKKKKRNNKKKLVTTGDKTENLISKTFKASKLQNAENQPLLNCLEQNFVGSTNSNSIGNSENILNHNPLFEAIVNVGRQDNSEIHTLQNETSGVNSLSGAPNSIKNNKKRNRKLKNTQSQSSAESPSKSSNNSINRTAHPSRTVSAWKNSGNKEEIAEAPTSGPLQNKIFKKENINPSLKQQRRDKIGGSSANQVEVLKANKVSSNNNNSSLVTDPMDKVRKEKTREEILAERQAKKLSKQNVQKGQQIKPTNIPNATHVAVSDTNTNLVKNDVSNDINNTNATEVPLENVKDAQKSTGNQKSEKSREEILAEREAKKLAKQAAKNKNKNTIEDGEQTKVIKETKESELKRALPPAAEMDASNKQAVNVDILANKLENIQMNVSEGQKKKPATKAERRAIQEAQREAKAKLLAEKQQTQKTAALPKGDASKKEIQAKTIPADNRKTEKAATITSPCKLRPFKVKFFNQLEAKIEEQNLFVNNPQIHPAMVKLGEQYAKRIVVGSNARCIAFLNSLKMVIQDYVTPPKKEFSRGLEANIKNCVDHLKKCRPLAVSVSNAYKYIKVVLTKLPSNQPESELKKHLVELIDIYIKDQIEKAAQAISYNVQESISNGDVILTYGCSSLITYILEEAHRKQIDFRVIAVDSRPFSEGQELLRRLVAKGISCTCVLINAVGFVMPEATKVLLGAHALLANGYVVSRIGTAQVALVARSFNVSVFVCCEKHKFSERTQTDAIVYNELGNPNDLISKTKDCRLMDWKSFPSLYPLNLNYDVTPPELVNVVVTEVTLMPSTSAPVILRIRPNEMLS